MKKFMTYFIILLVVMLPVLGVDAAKKKKTTTTTTTQAGEKVNFYVFYGSTCPHCKELHEYIAELESDPTINYMFKVVDYEVWSDAENNSLMVEVADEMNLKTEDGKLGVPIYVIGEEIFSGYSERSNESIRATIEKAYKNTDTKDVVGPIADEILSGDRAASESNKNKTVGFIILAVTAIVVIAVLFSKNNTTYYDDDEDESDDEDEKVDNKEKEVKKTTTKSTTTKKTNTKSKK